MTDITPEVSARILDADGKRDSSIDPDSFAQIGELITTETGFDV